MKKSVILAISIFALIFVACKSTPEAEVTEEVVTEDVAVEEETPVQSEEPVVETPVKDFGTDNQLYLDKLLAARQAAIAAKAPELIPDQFNETEAIYNEKTEYVKAHLADSDFSAEIKDLTLRYQALANAADAYATKLKIDELGLAEYDKTNYQKGEDSLNNVIELYNNGADNSDLVAATQAGKEAYSKVLLTGLKKVAATARTNAINQKKKADSVYAGVAEKEIYKTCSAKITSADSHLVTGNPEAALKGYQDAAASFATLYESVSSKRLAAQARIDEAKAAIEKAKTYAEQADEIAPLKEAVAGIEDENTVLLEDDTYSNPEEAAIDVNESVTGKAAAALESVAAEVTGGAE